MLIFLFGHMTHGSGYFGSRSWKNLEICRSPEEAILADFGRNEKNSLGVQKFLFDPPCDPKSKFHRVSPLANFIFHLPTHFWVPTRAIPGPKKSGQIVAVGAQERRFWPILVEISQNRLVSTNRYFTPMRLKIEIPTMWPPFKLHFPSLGTILGSHGWSRAPWNRGKFWL